MSSKTTAAAEKPVQTLSQRLPAFAAYAIIATVIVTTANTLFPNFTRDKSEFIYTWSPHNLVIYTSIAYVFVVKVLGPLYHSLIRNQDGKIVQYEATKKFWVNVMIGWNTFLVILSITCLFGLVYHLFDFFRNDVHDVKDLFCSIEPHFMKHTGWIWLHIFIWSKFPELFDTIIILARGRQPDFLHWYHHFTVLTYCFYCGAYWNPIGVYFAAINSFVHTVMYDYYKMQGYGFRLSYDKRITQIQTIQMVLGIAISCAFIYYNSILGDKCAMRPASTTYYMFIGTVVMYGSYLILFLKFYIGRYFAKKPAVKKE